MEGGEGREGEGGRGDKSEGKRAGDWQTEMRIGSRLDYSELGRV